MPAPPRSATTRPILPGTVTGVGELVVPPGRRRRVRARARQLIAEEMTLRDLRKALAKTQARVAKKLGVGQDTISRDEQRSDLPLSTLQSYVEAMGGELSLIAEFPEREAVRIRTIGDITGRAGPELTKAFPCVVCEQVVPIGPERLLRATEYYKQAGG